MNMLKAHFQYRKRDFSRLTNVKKTYEGAALLKFRQQGYVGVCVTFESHLNHEVCFSTAPLAHKLNPTDQLENWQRI